MSNTYTWTITKLQCYSIYEGKNNVVRGVDFLVSATDGVNVAVANNTLMLSCDELQNFIEYDALTLEIVLKWVQDALGSNGINKLQSELDFMISKLSNPPVIAQDLP